MHGLFDHGSVFSVVLQIISKRGGNLSVAWKSVVAETNARLRGLVATRDCRNHGQLQEPQESNRYWKTA